MREKCARTAAAICALILFLLFISNYITFASQEPNDIFKDRTPEQETDSSHSGVGFFRDRDPREPSSDNTGNDPQQLTEEDLIAMNHNDYAILYSEAGYLTFLRGKYYEDKVLNSEDGIKSLFGIQQLLGISKGSAFFCVYSERNSEGYTFYTYQQRYGDTTLQNAVLKIVVDPDGYTAGLISSFVPEVGFAPEDETSITKEEAMEAVKKAYPEMDFLFFADDIRQTSITIDEIAIHCWAVFTDIPVEGGMIGDRPYLEHLVSYDGNYLGYTAVVSTKELVKGDEVQYAAAMAWFEGKTADTYTGYVTFHDGSKKEITVPVVKDNETGTYYLADLNRNILVADYASFEYGRQLVPCTSEDNTGWPEHYLLTYNSYIQVYDFYAGHGMRSVDGFGIPILILADCCYYDGSPINNAFFAGFDSGWAKFGASAVNDYGECIDVIGHEFTHGITTYTFAGDLYENETGAVNEALSDIMGNLIEMLLGATEDTTWLIAENTGNPLRSMSFPWGFRQPVQIEGDFYQPRTEMPSNDNDLGGVHTNSSLVNYVAWQLCAQGMPPEEAFRLWQEVIKLLTPLSGFREVHQALLFAADMLEMDVLWLGRIEMLCTQAGY